MVTESVLKKSFVVLLALLITACGSPSSPRKLDLHIEITRPKVLRCGEVSVDNVCLNDVAHIVATSAKVLVMYRYSEFTHEEKVLLTCPSADARCQYLFGAIFVRYELSQHGRVRVFAVGEDLVPEDDYSELIPLHHNGKYKLITLDVRL
ncbi:MAG: hypothetical protein KBC69_03200 [Candidatus Magasanikbacteria bacterium]|nr:hypothetical protein [Candidatus Magasanikbacteria bacterium]